jgi:hypothetical protein
MRGFDYMKNYVVKVLRYFRDLEEKKERFVGDEFKTTKERYEFLKSKGAVELVKAPKEKKEINEENSFEEEKTDELVDEIITKKKRTSKK